MIKCKTKNSKIVERGKIDTPNTHIHDCSLSLLSTGTSIKSGGVKLVLWAPKFPCFVKRSHWWRVATKKSKCYPFRGV